MNPGNSNLEVVAIEAIVPEVECGAGRVFVRMPFEDVYFKLIGGKAPTTPTSFLSRDEMSHMQNEGRLMFLPHAVPSMTDAMAVYVSQSFAEKTSITFSSLAEVVKNFETPAGIVY